MSFINFLIQKKVLKPTALEQKQYFFLLAILAILLAPMTGPAGQNQFALLSGQSRDVPAEAWCWRAAGTVASDAFLWPVWRVSLKVRNLTYS